MCPVAHRDVLPTVSRHQFREVHFLRRRKIFLEGRLELRDRQVPENSAAVIVDQHNRQRPAQLRPNQEAVRVVQQREIAREQHRRPPGTMRHTQRRRQSAIDPIGPAIAERTQPATPRRHDIFHVPHRHRI